MTTVYVLQYLWNIDSEEQRPPGRDIEKVFLNKEKAELYKLEKEKKINEYAELKEEYYKKHKDWQLLNQKPIYPYKEIKITPQKRKEYDILEKEWINKFDSFNKLNDPKYKEEYKDMEDGIKYFFEIIEFELDEEV